MSEIVREWFNKAEGDYGVAGRELAVENLTDYGAVCFHAQQCVEKLIKGILVSHNVVPPYIHDLVRLGRMLHEAEPTWSWDEAQLADLTDAATDDRYPGASATLEDAQEMFDLCTRLRESLHRLLPSRE